MTPDTLRTTALAAAAAAQCLVPTMGPLLLGTREEVDDHDTVVTPPDYAFAVWAPIFAATVGHAVQQTLPANRTAGVNRAVGWPLAAAYTINTGWSVAAQTDRFALTPALLPASTACTALAHRRLQRETGAGGLAPVATGLLLGWTTLASAVNLLAATQLLGARATSRASVSVATVASLAVAAGLSRGVARSRSGGLALAAPAVWGLTTTALDRRRPTATRLATAAGALSIAASAARSRMTR